jgi:RimJ/RimL family protein N-acetyltransferase
MTGPFERRTPRGALVFLRPMESEDVELVHAWQQDGEYRRLMGDPPRSLVMRRRRFDELLSEQGGDVYSFVICRIDDGQPVGRTDLFHIDRVNGSAAFGIGIGEHELWGKGYGSDAVNALVDFAFGELRLERVYLATDAANARAQRAYAKAGFVVEARRRHAWVENGRMLDEIRMSLLREEWLALPRRRSRDHLPTATP